MAENRPSPSEIAQIAAGALQSLDRVLPDVVADTERLRSLTLAELVRLFQERVRGDGAARETQVVHSVSQSFRALPNLTGEDFLKALRRIARLAPRDGQ